MTDTPANGNGQEPASDAQEFAEALDNVLRTNGVVFIRNRLTTVENDLADIPVAALEALVYHLEGNLEQARHERADPSALLAGEAELAAHRIFLDARRRLVELGEQMSARAEVVADISSGAKGGGRLRRPRR